MLKLEIELMLMLRFSLTRMITHALAPRSCSCSSSCSCPSPSSCSCACVCPCSCSASRSRPRLRSRHAHAHAQAQVQHSDKVLELLSRAHACYKERGYYFGMRVTALRIAEEYLSADQFATASQLYERFQQNKAPLWPSLGRFALERSILCSCRAISPDQTPNVCFASRGMPPRQPLSGDKKKEKL